VKTVLVPTTDTNSERGVIVAWKVDSNEAVAEGEPIADVETSKAVIEVPAPAGGFLLQLFEEGTEVELVQPIAAIFTEQAELIAHVAKLAEEKAKAPAAEEARATVKAKERARELGVDLASIAVPGLITVKHVEDRAAKSTRRVDLPSPLSISGVERILLIGGGLGATQVIDIFRAGDRQRAVAILDDDPAKWGQDVYGVPVSGGSDRLRELFAAGTFDAAVVAISTSIKVRAKFRRMCEELGIPLANAIDPTAKIASEVKIGRGNVICAFCQLGTSTVVGDNNFISAYNSFDHHNVLGNDISTGPGCMTSGQVKIGDRCRFGTGIFIEPHVVLGEDVRVASGAVIVKDVPARHTVKTKMVTTVVVPNRE
jgi:sugar O-acyltransferase (sialic acid O-acetyltransferase NeuD family)